MEPVNHATMHIAVYGSSYPECGSIIEDVFYKDFPKYVWMPLQVQVPAIKEEYDAWWEWYEQREKVVDYHGRLAWVGGRCQKCEVEWGIWVPLDEPDHCLMRGGICCEWCARRVTRPELREALNKSTGEETVMINEKG